MNMNYTEEKTNLFNIVFEYLKNNNGCNIEDKPIMLNYFGEQVPTYINELYINDYEDDVIVDSHIKGYDYGDSDSFTDFSNDEMKMIMELCHISY